MYNIKNKTSSTLVRITPIFVVSSLCSGCVFLFDPALSENANSDADTEVSDAEVSGDDADADSTEADVSDDTGDGDSTDSDTATGPTCEELSCESRFRECTDDGEAAVCGGCIDTYTERDGDCVPDLVCSTADDCGAPASSAWGACEKANVCDSTGTRSRELTLWLCESGVCTAGNTSIEEEFCEESAEGNECDEGVCRSGVCVSAPANVQASDGNVDGTVRVTWSPVPGARAYEVFRNETKIIETADTFHTDIPANVISDVPPPEQLLVTTTLTDRIEVSWLRPAIPIDWVLSYTVRAVFASGPSDFSAADPGSPGFRVELAAGDDEFSDRGEATSFSDTNAPAGRIVLGAASATTDLASAVDLRLDSANTEPGSAVNYRIRTASGARFSTTLADSGNRSVGAPRIQWQRANALPNFADLIGITGMTASDTTAAPGQAYFYRARVTADGSAPLISGTVTGQISCPDNGCGGCSTGLVEGDACGDCADGLATCSGTSVVCSGGTTSCGAAPDCVGDATNPVVDLQGTSRFSSLAVGESHACGLFANGQVECWGDNDAGQANVPAGEFVSIAVGGDFSCALLNETQRPVCWGNNADSRLDLPTTTSFRALALGSAHACALDAAGRTICTGAGSAATPPDRVLTSIVAAGERTCALALGGELVCWGTAFTGTAVPTDEAFRKIAIGRELGCGLQYDGSIRCWGQTAGLGISIAGSYDDLFVGDGFVCGRAGTNLTCSGDIPADELPATSWAGAAAGGSTLCGMGTARPLLAAGTECQSNDMCFVGGECFAGRCVTSGFAYVPITGFQMGSPNGEQGRGDDEDLHPVQLSQPFEIARTEVTQVQWQSLLAGTPASFADCGKSCPVENVTWYAALSYANAVSAAAELDSCFTLSRCSNTASSGRITCNSVTVTSSGRSPYACEGYRLPTEAEWEVTARGGTNTATFLGALTTQACETTLNSIAWYCSNPLMKPNTVGSLIANPWGLFDVAGNVSEWVWDGYNDYSGAAANPTGDVGADNNVYRGGSWSDRLSLLRHGDRASTSPGTRSNQRGFRIARTLP